MNCKSRYLLILLAALGSYFASMSVFARCELPLGIERFTPQSPYLSHQQQDNGMLTESVNIINYWATWCGPCVKELPMLNALAEQGIAVTTIHVGNKPKQIQAMFARLAITRLPTTFIDDFSPVRKFGFNGLPASLIAVKGQIKYKITGYIKTPEPELVEWLTCLAK